MFKLSLPRPFVFALVPALLLVGSCAINPLTGKRELALIPESQEIQMGKQAAAEVAATVGIYDNAALNRYVESIGRKLVGNSERPDLPWSFQVADDPVVNAFALPGGPNYVTRGLLAHLNSEAQLAAVMGHEAGHITGRHSVRQMSKALPLQLGLMIGMAVSDTVASLGQLGMGGLQLLTLSYGRDAEREADDLGFRYSIKSGYEVREMPGVFATLKRVSEAAGGQHLPNWLSSHPSPDERIERINEHIAKDNPPKGEVGSNPFFAAIDGIVYGPDPRHGFFEAGVFKHPELKFQLKTPAGWKSQNMSQAVIAQAPDGKTAFQLALAKEGSPAEALTAFTTQKGMSNVQPLELQLQVPGKAARFTAETEGGPAAGVIVFVSHGGKTFGMLGVGPAATFPSLEPAITAAASSFGPLTDAAALQVTPARIKIINVPSAMTVAELAARYPSVPADRLAIINQVEPGTRLEAGRKFKIVEGKVRSESGGGS